MLDKPKNRTAFDVILENNKLVRFGRPAFSSSVYKNISAISGLEDRRHMLHGATQITNVLIDSFNRVIAKNGMEALNKKLDAILKNLLPRSYNIKIKKDYHLVNKVKDVITFAFGREENLVAGLAVENRGIERARQSIQSIKTKINALCVEELKTDDEIRNDIMQLIDENISHGTQGEISLYKTWILKVLRDSIKSAKDAVEIIRILHDFEFSCTLDIEHEKTSKTQNIWGITMATKLHKAISNHDEESIYLILLGPAHLRVETRYKSLRIDHIENQLIKN